MGKAVLKRAMERKELFDGCVKLSEIAAARLDARRQLSWRLTLGFWAVLVASIAYFRVAALPIWMGVAVFAAHGFFMRGVFIRTAADTRILWHYFHQAQKILVANGVVQAEDKPELMIGANLSSNRKALLSREKLGFIFHWGVFFELFVTGALIVLVYAICANEVTRWSLVRG